jgi:hypothetical protein
VSQEKTKYINLPRVVPNVQTNAKHQMPSSANHEGVKGQNASTKLSKAILLKRKEVAQRCELAS